MDQLVFKFPFKTKYYEQDFYVSSNNFSAYKLIESWPNWPDKWLNIFAEYFHLNGQVDDFNSLNQLGSSTGYYLMSEMFIPNTKVAPFVRFESWDQFNQDQSTDQYQRVFGINWYKNKDKVRFGAAYTLSSTEIGNLRDEKVQIFSMFNY